MTLLTRIKTHKELIQAIAILVGTMVGVGIFGIPITFAKAGFWVGTLFLFFAAGVTALFTLMFAEIVLRTSGKHQLVGYTEKYLGKIGKNIVFFTNTLGIYGALLAYIIVAGEFLNNIFSHTLALGPFQYSLLFVTVVSLSVLLGLKREAWIEVVLTVMFIAVMLVILGFGIWHVDLTNLKGHHIADWFLPYGVLLFAFAGLTSVPIQREILVGRENLLKKSILISIALVGILYLLFAFVVVGVSGPLTSEDSLAGLFSVLGSKIIFLGSVFGVLAMSTAYLALAIALRDVFKLDFRFGAFNSWLLTVMPPAVLFLIGLRNFIGVISLVGSVAIGLESVVLIFVYFKAHRHGDRQPEFTLRLPKILYYFLGLVFLAGVVYMLAS